MARFRFFTVAAVLVAAGLVIASEDAQAQCSGSNPLMKCPLAVCQSLQAIVKSAVACGDHKAWSTTAGVLE